jgi:hypothetical protein
MYISGEGLLVILLAGLIAGWLAGKIVAGGGFGLIGDIAVELSALLSALGCCPAWDPHRQWPRQHHHCRHYRRRSTLADHRAG